LVLSLLGTPAVVRLFRRRGYGQEIREDGPSSHAVKRGTPTMGGVVIIVATLIGYFVAHLFVLNQHGRGPTASALLVLGLMISLGTAGFILFAYLVVTATSNAVNLTDGLDGLASGTSVMVFASYVVIAFWEFGNACTRIGPGIAKASCYNARDPLDVALVAAA